MLPRDKLPSFIVDVTNYIDKWEKALRLYKSQVNPLDKTKNLFSVIKSSKTLQGSLIGCNYAEGFLSEEPLKVDEEMLFKL